MGYIHVNVESIGKQSAVVSCHLDIFDSCFDVQASIIGFDCRSAAFEVVVDRSFVETNCTARIAYNSDNSKKIPLSDFSQHEYRFHNIPIDFNSFVNKLFVAVDINVERLSTISNMSS